MTPMDEMNKMAEMAKQIEFFLVINTIPEYYLNSF